MKISNWYLEKTGKIITKGKSFFNKMSVLLEPMLVRAA